MPMIAPSAPTQRSQPRVTPASTATRAPDVGGSTASRYAWSWASNSSQQGSDTTRVGIPSASSASAAPRPAAAPSPVRDQDQRRASPAASPRRVGARSRPARRPRAPFSAVPASVGSFWRVSASATGPSAPLDGERPRGGRLVGVARPDEPQVRASRAARRSARPAGGSGRPRRGRPSRASRRR